MSCTTPTNLIINYLPQSLTDDEFKSMFQSIGKLNSCKIIRDRATNYSYGFGFVDYESEQDAARAIETLNGLQLQNKRIKVAYSRNHDKVKGANLYVRNIPRDYNQEQLQALSEPYGKVVNVRILTDPNTNMSKGVGFVLYDTKDEAVQAQAALDGLVPDGATEPLNVKFAEDNANKQQKRPPFMVVQNQYQQQGPGGWGGGYQGGPHNAGGYQGGPSQRGGYGGGPGGGYGGGGPARNQGRYNQRYNPFAGGNQQQQQQMGGGGGGMNNGAGGEDGHVLFVYNIGPEADERAVWQLFAPFGTVAKVNVIRDFAKGVGKGYGFVSMPNMVEAQAAITGLSGYRYCGKPLQVSFKTSKQ